MNIIMCDIVLSSTRWPSTKPPWDAVNGGNDGLWPWPHPRGHLGGAGHEMKEEMKIERLAVSPSADSPQRTSYRQMKFARGKIVSIYRLHPGVGES